MPLIIILLSFINYSYAKPPCDSQIYDKTDIERIEQLRCPVYAAQELVLFNSQQKKDYLKLALGEYTNKSKVKLANEMNCEQWNKEKKMFQRFKEMIGAGKFSNDDRSKFSYQSCNNNVSSILGLSYSSLDCGKNLITEYRPKGFSLNNDEYNEEVHLKKLQSIVKKASGPFHKVSDNHYTFVVGNKIYGMRTDLPARANPTFEYNLQNNKSLKLVGAK